MTEFHPPFTNSCSDFSPEHQNPPPNEDPTALIDTVLKPSEQVATASPPQTLRTEVPVAYVKGVASVVGGAWAVMIDDLANRRVVDGRVVFEGPRAHEVDALMSLHAPLREIVDATVVETGELSTPKAGTELLRRMLPGAVGRTAIPTLVEVLNATTPESAILAQGHPVDLNAHPTAKIGWAAARTQAKHLELLWTAAKRAGRVFRRWLLPGTAKSGK